MNINPGTRPNRLRAKFAKGVLFRNWLKSFSMLLLVLVASVLLWHANAFSAPCYVELYQQFNAPNTGWRTVNLGGYGVPANAVVEIAVYNDNTGGERQGGVRAVGSGLNRYMDLHEPEAGGLSWVTMHVQTDASSQIQTYSENTGDIRFRLVGYWTEGTYVETWNAMDAGGNDAWRNEDLSAFGVGANQVAEVIIYNDDTGAERWGGVRTDGSGNDRRIQLQEAESNGQVVVTMLVQASNDANARIELYSDDVNDVDFYLAGYWTTTPGRFTEAWTDLGKPAGDGTWTNVDVSANSTVGGIMQIVLSNQDTNEEEDLGVRQDGSGTSRLPDVCEAEAGGREAVSMHVNADNTQIIEYYAQDRSDAVYFYSSGYWDLRPDATSYTNDTEAGLNNLGARIGQTVTITGVRFGTTCSSPNNVVNIGTYEIPTGNTTWTSDTSITFTIPAGINVYGGAGTNGLVVETCGNVDPTPLDFYVYPDATSVTTPFEPNDYAREYDAGDTDGVITIVGNRFGTAGSVTILGQAATETGVGYTDTAIEVEVPAAIADNAYTGNIVVTRSTPADSRTDTFGTLRVLPRITSLNPATGCSGTAVQVLGNHFCQTGVCPTAGNRGDAANNVTFFNSQMVADGNVSGWTDTQVDVACPAAASTGNVVLTSATNYTSNGSAFTMLTVPPAQSNWDPGTGDTICSSEPIEIDLDVAGDCRWSFDGDESYDNMADDGDCTGDGTASATCTLSGVVSGNVWFACKDTSCNNKDTNVTNDVLNFTVNNTVPTQSAWNPAKTSVTTSSPSITLTLNKPGDCKWSLTDQDYDSMGDDCTGDGTTSITCSTSGLLDGNEIVYVACNDSCGNKDSIASNEHIDYYVDEDTPVQSAHDPADAATVYTSAPTISFTLDENGDCKWSLTDQAYSAMGGDCSGDGTTSIICTPLGMSAVDDTVYLACADSYSNEDTIASNTELTFTVNVPTPPSTWNYSEDTAETKTTTSTAWVEKVSLSFTAETDDYLVIAVADIMGEDDGASWYARLQQDNTTDLMEWAQVVSDGANPTEREWRTVAGAAMESLTAGAVQFDLDYRAEAAGGNQETRIRNARVFALQMLPGGSGYYNSAETLAQSGTDNWSTEVTMNITPATAGDYLVIGSAEMRSDNTGDRVEARLDIDGTNYLARVYEDDDTNDWHPFFAIRIVNFTAAAHTIRIEGDCPNGGGADMRKARVAAIRLSDAFTYTAADTANSRNTETTGSTTYQTKADGLTFTPASVNDYAIIGAASYNQDNVADHNDTRFLYDGVTELQRTEGECKDTADYKTAAALYTVNASAAAHTVVYQYREHPSSPSGVNVAARDAAIVALRKPPIISVGKGGSQPTYMCGTAVEIGRFNLVSDGDTGQVSSITISDTGTANANTDLANVELWYDTNCTWDGDEVQYGGTTTFDAADGDAVFTAALGVTATKLCMYVVADVIGGGGSTIQYNIASGDIATTNAYLSANWPVQFDAVTLDNAPPAPSNFSPADNGDICGTTGTATFDTDENAACRWSLTDQTFAAMAEDCIPSAATGTYNTSHTCNLFGLTAGNEQVFYSCEDSCGNADDASTNELLDYFVDITGAPVQSNWNPADAADINTTTPSITLNLDQNGDCYASLDGDESYANMADDVNCTGDGSQSITCAMSGLAEGSNNIYIACQDSCDADTALTNTMLTYDVDTTAPDQTGWNPASGTIVCATSVDIVVDTDENAWCRWSLTDQSYTNMADDCANGGTQSLTCSTTGLMSGLDDVYISCKDAATNEETWLTNADLQYNVDVSAPVSLAQLTPANGAVDQDFNPTLYATGATDVDTISYYFEIAKDTGYSVDVQNSGWQSADDDWVVPAALDPNTTYYWRIKAKDGCGNTSAYTGDYSFTTLPVTPNFTYVSFLQASDASGDITVTYDLTDFSNDASKLLIEYSTNTVTWHQAYIKSSSAGAVDNTNVDTGTANWQITGIPTPQDDATFVWETKNAGNEAGVFTGEDDSVYMKITTFDAATGETEQSASFTVDNRAPKNFSCQTPPNGTTGVSTDPTLTIAAGTDISSITYWIQIAEDSGFTTGLQETPVWQAGLTWDPATLTQGQQYFWHVKAKDAYGNEASYTTPIWDFIVATNEPDVNIDSIQQTSTDGTGIITVTYDITDPQTENCNLLIEFSIDGGATWRQAYIGASDDGVIDNALVPGGTSLAQITGISTDQSNITFTWDSDHANNEGGAYADESITIYMKITPDDGTNTGQTRYSAFFAVDNKAPSGLALQYPTNGGTNVDIDATLTVVEPTDISTVLYWFQVDRDDAPPDWVAPDFQEVADWVSDNSWTVTTSLAYATQYEYRAKAKDQYGNEGSFVVSWEFTSRAAPDSSAWPFTTASNYSYNTTKIAVNTGLGKLRPDATPEWCDDDFTYRKAITVNNSANPITLTDHQVKVTLTPGVFTFANAENDGKDIYFYDTDCDVQSHWKASYTFGVTAEIWVKVEDVAASSNTTIYMYYGDASAAESSSLGNTMATATYSDGAASWVDLVSSSNVDTDYGTADVIVGTPLIVDGSVVTIDCDSGCYYPYIQVLNGGKITTTSEKALKLYAREIYVDSFSSINVSRLGHAGGAQDDSCAGTNDGTSHNGTPGDGGGGGGLAAGNDGPGGGGGAHGGVGGQGGDGDANNSTQGAGGATTYGNRTSSADANLYFGSGGGSGGKSCEGGCGATTCYGGPGGEGGGAILLDAVTINIEGNLRADGAAGAQGHCLNDNQSGGAGGGGAGGTIMLRGSSVTVDAASNITADGGNGGPENLHGGPGGGGGGGYVKIFCETCNVAATPTTNGGAAGDGSGAPWQNPAAGSATAGGPYETPGGTYTYSYTWDIADVQGTITSDDIDPFFRGGILTVPNWYPTDPTAGTLSIEVQKASDSSALCTLTGAEAAAGTYDTSSCTETDAPVKLYADLDLLKAPGTPYVQNWSYDYYTRNRPDLTTNTSVGAEQTFVYYTDHPTIMPALSNGQVFAEVLSYTATIPEGTVEFQCSNNGSNWYYHNGSNWVAESSAGYPTQTNTAAEINAEVDTLDNDVGDGTFFFRAFMISNGALKSHIDNVDITYILPAAPTVTSLSPACPGGGTSGQEITINGTNFGIAQAGSSVSFDGVDAGAANDWSDTQIKIYAPTDVSAGYVIVTVNSVQSQQDVAATFCVKAPSITSITPNQGYWSDTVLIEGTSFGSVQGNSTVTFDTGRTASCTSWTDTALTCKVPSGAITGNVTVTTSGGSDSTAFTITTDNSMWPFEVPTDYATSSVNLYVNSGLGALQTINATPWGNTNWHYRHALTITNSTGSDQTNFQVAINLTSSNFDFDNANASGDDIRFADSTAAMLAANLQDYWIESYDSVNKTAKIWVEVKDVPVAGTTIYLYYGNDSVGAVSNKDSTFPKTPDYSDGSGAWTDTNTATNIDISTDDAFLEYQSNVTPRTCEDTWDNTCSGCTNYNEAPVNCTNCAAPCITCASNNCNGSEAIDSFQVNQGTFLDPGSNITVNVDYHCYNNQNDFCIAYAGPNDAAWTIIQCQACAGGGVYTNWTSNAFALDNDMGTHKIRAAMNWAIGGTWSCATRYCDTDTVNVYSNYKAEGDITSNDLTGFMGGITFTSPNTVPGGNTLSYSVKRASDDYTMCTISYSDADSGYAIGAGDCANASSTVYLQADFTSDDVTETPDIEDWTFEYYRRQTGNVNVSVYGTQEARQYPTDSPYVTNNTGLAFQEIISFTEILGPENTGDVQYQVSNDGASWYYHDGASWTATVGGYTDSNTGTELNTNLEFFEDDVAAGTFYFKAFLHSDGSEPTEIDGISINIAQITITEMMNNGTGTIVLEGDDFVQFYNPFSVSYDLENHVLGDGDGSDYTFGAGNSIDAKSYYLIARDQATFINRFGCEAAKVNEWGATLDLNSAGDEVYVKQTAVSTTSLDAVVWGAYNGADLPEGAFTAPPGSAAAATADGECLKRLSDGYEGNEKDTGADADTSPENEEALGSNFSVTSMPTPYCIPPSAGSLTLNVSGGYTNDSSPAMTISCEDPVGTPCNSGDFMRIGCSEAEALAASWDTYETKCNEVAFSCTFDITTVGDCGGTAYGTRTLYIQFKNQNGNIQSVFATDEVIYDIVDPEITEVLVYSDDDDYLCGSSGTCVTLFATSGGSVFYNNLGGEGHGQKMTVELVWNDPAGMEYEYIGQFAFSDPPTYDGATIGSDTNGADGWKQVYQIDSGETDETDISFTVYDMAGNSTSVDLSFLMDNYDPGITYNSPSAGGRTNWYKDDPGNVINIDFGYIGSGTADHSSPLYTAQYREALGSWEDIFSGFQSSDYTDNWEVDFNSLSEGVVEISVKATDGCGNSKTHTYVENTTGFVFRKDITPPVISSISIGSDAEGYFWGNGGDTLDCSSVGAYPGVTCTPWFNSLNGEGGGQEIYVTVVWDDGATQDRMQGDIAFGDNPAPDYTGAPKAGAGDWTIYYSVENNATSQLAIDISVYDEAGNTDSVKIDFKADNIDPTLTYNYPASSGGMTTWYSANPGAVIDVDVEWPNPSAPLYYADFQVVSAGVWESLFSTAQVASFTANWDPGWATCTQDNNGISIRAADVVGNVMTHTYSSGTFGVNYRRDTVPPAIRYNDPATGGVTLWYSAEPVPNTIIDVDLQWASGSQIALYEYQVQGTGVWGTIWSGGQYASYTTDWGIAWASMSEGVNFVDLRGTDAASNVRTDTFATDSAGFRFYIDQTAPDNPAAVSGWDTPAKGTVITTGNGYSYANPYFEWAAPSDNPAPLNSGVSGYYVTWSTDNASTPVPFQTAATYEVNVPGGMTDCETYYLRMKTADSATPTNVSAVVTAFQFTYTGAGLFGITEAIGDNTWRNATGTSYDIDFDSTCTDLDYIQYSIWSGPNQGAGTGTELLTWYTYAGPGIATNSYTTDVELTDAAWNAATDGVNWVSFRSYDASNNNIFTDVFYLRKDTLGPESATATAYNDSGKAVTLTDTTWYSYTNPYFEWNATPDNPQAPALNSGFSTYSLYFGTDSSGAVNYSTAGTSFATGGSLVSGYTYYLRMSGEDTLGNATGTSQVRMYKYDNTDPDNPVAASGWDTSAKGTGLVSGTGYGYANPYFEWATPNDNPGAPASSAGVGGYYVTWSTNAASTPVPFQTAATYEVTVPGSMTLCSSYYLRVRTSDAATPANVATTVTLFSYTYTGGANLFTITDNAGDTTWRNATGTTYDVDVEAACYDLDYIQYTIWSGPDMGSGTGTELFAWTTFVGPAIGTDTYTVDWELTDAAWNAATDGVNWISIKPFNVNGAYQIATDVVFLKKDTQAPDSASATAYNNSGKAVTLSDTTWYSYPTPYFEWAAVSDNPAAPFINSGFATYTLYFGTDSSGAVNYATTATSYATGGSLVSGYTHYLRMSGQDNAGNATGTHQARIYKYDSDPPDNPAAPVSGWASDSKAVPIVNALVGGYAHDYPYFEWFPPSDNPGAPASSAGINGYYIGFSTDNASVPVYFQTAATYTAVPYDCQAWHYLRIKTIDNATPANATGTVTAFSFYWKGSPVITDNQADDPNWYNAVGATYDVDFGARCGNLDYVQYAIWTRPDMGSGTGTELITWTTLLGDPAPGDMGVQTYTADWAIPAAGFTAATDGVNWVSVRVYTNEALTETATDVFSFQKDTLAPTNPTTTAYNSYAMGSTLTDNTWYGYANPYFEWATGTERPTPRSSGMKNYMLYFGTNVAGAPNYATTTAAYVATQALVTGTTYYLRMSATDNLDQAATTTTIFTYKYDVSDPDNTAPVPVNAWDTAAKAVALVNGGSYSYPTPYFEWAAPVDNPGAPANSGVKGYYVGLGTDAASIPMTFVSGATYTAAAPAGACATNVYFRIRTVDNTIPENATGAVTAFSFFLQGGLSITDNQADDLTWYNAVSATTYNVDFVSTCENINYIQYSFWTAADMGAGTGAEIMPWTTFVGPNYGAYTYTADWPINAAAFASATEGVNWVSVRVFTDSLVTQTDMDVFTFRKDTTPPTILTATTTESSDYIWISPANGRMYYSDANHGMAGPYAFTVSGTASDSLSGLATAGYSAAFGDAQGTDTVNLANWTSGAIYDLTAGDAADTITVTLYDQAGNTAATTIPSIQNATLSVRFATMTPPTIPTFPMFAVFNVYYPDNITEMTLNNENAGVGLFASPTLVTSDFVVAGSGSCDPLDVYDDSASAGPEDIVVETLDYQVGGGTCGNVYSTTTSVFCLEFFTDDCLTSTSPHYIGLFDENVMTGGYIAGIGEDTIDGDLGAAISCPPDLPQVIGTFPAHTGPAYLRAFPNGDGLITEDTSVSNWCYGAVCAATCKVGATDLFCSNMGATITAKPEFVKYQNSTPTVRLLTNVADDSEPAALEWSWDSTYSRIMIAKSNHPTDGATTTFTPATGSEQVCVELIDSCDQRINKGNWHDEIVSLTLESATWAPNSGQTIVRNDENADQGFKNMTIPADGDFDDFDTGEYVIKGKLENGLACMTVTADSIPSDDPQTPIKVTPEFFGNPPLTISGGTNTPAFVLIRPNAGLASGAAQFAGFNEIHIVATSTTPTSATAGIVLSPDWSNDGKKMALVSRQSDPCNGLATGTQGNNFNLYTLQMDQGVLRYCRRLTSNDSAGIGADPSSEVTWMQDGDPDNDKIIFSANDPLTGLLARKLLWVSATGSQYFATGTQYTLSPYESSPTDFDLLWDANTGAATISISFPCNSLNVGDDIVIGEGWVAWNWITKSIVRTVTSVDPVTCVIGINPVMDQDIFDLNPVTWDEGFVRYPVTLGGMGQSLVETDVFTDGSDWIDPDWSPDDVNCSGTYGGVAVRDTLLAVRTPSMDAEDITCTTDPAVVGNSYQNIVQIYGAKNDAGVFNYKTDCSVSNLRKVTHFSSNETVPYKPKWSPDCSRIAFMVHDATQPNPPSDTSIYMINLSDNSPGFATVTLPVTSLSQAGVYKVYDFASTSQSAYTPNWSADGKLISFSLDKTGTFDMTMMNSGPDSLVDNLFYTVDFDSYLEYVMDNNDQMDYILAPQLVGRVEHNEFALTQCPGNLAGASCPNDPNFPFVHVAQISSIEGAYLRQYTLDDKTSIENDGGILFLDGIITAIFPPNVLASDTVFWNTDPTTGYCGLADTDPFTVTPDNNADNANCPLDPTNEFIVQAGDAREYFPDGTNFTSYVRLMFHYCDSDNDGKVDDTPANTAGIYTATSNGTVSFTYNGLTNECSIGGVVTSGGTIDEDAVAVYNWDKNNTQWVMMPGIVDKVNNNITVFSDHFSRYDTFGFRYGLQGPLPERLSLTGIRTYPNPYIQSQHTGITFAATGAGGDSDYNVNIKIYDIRGSLVRTLVNTLQAPNTVNADPITNSYTLVDWGVPVNNSGRLLASGIYLYYMVARDTQGYQVTHKGKFAVVR